MSYYNTPEATIRTNATPLTTKYTVMFDRDIEESNHFHHEFCIMEQAGEGDIVEVSISSFGGSVATISRFQDIIKNSPAHFHGKLTGYGYSAGGAMFLLCDTQEVADLASFMAHSIQAGYSGATQALTAHSSMTSRQNEQLCNMLYKDFFNEEEIARICDGAEMWLDSDQIKERLEHRDGIRTARLDEEETAAFNEKYDADSYAAELLQNLTEELDGLDFTLTDVFMSMTNLLQEKVSPEVVFEEEEKVELIEETVFVGKGGIEITESFLMGLSKPELKTIATELDIMFGNAVSMKTLRKLILDAVR